MKKLIQAAIIIIIIIGGYMKFFGSHNPFSPEIKYVNGKPYEVIKHDIDTIEVTKTTIKTKKGDDIYHDTTIYVPIPLNVDTLEIIKSFFAKNVYKDTLKLNDSLGFVFIQDTISQNKIASRKYVAKIKQREIKETTIVKELPKSHIYWGIGMGFDKINYVNNINANLLYQTKCQRIYGLGTGVDAYKTPFINATIYWKLK